MAETSQAGAHWGSPATKVGPQILRLIAGMGILFALGYFIARGGNFTSVRPELSQLGNSTPDTDREFARCGPSRQDRHPIDIEMLYSTDKRAWIELAADRFSRRCPSIQVKLNPMEDLAAAQALLSSAVHPTLWSPADDLSLRYLEYRRSIQPERPPLSIVERTLLVESPLVLLIWEDRLRVLSAILQSEPSSEGLWLRTLCPLIPRTPNLTALSTGGMVPGRWADWYAPLVAKPAKTRGRPAPSAPPAGREPLAELGAWGPVKIGSLMPTRYAVGVATLYLLSFDYLVPPQERQRPSQDLFGATLGMQDPPGADPEPFTHSFKDAFIKKKDALQGWLRRCQAGQSAASMPEQSMAESMFNLGPSQLDAVVTSEPVALQLLDRLDAHEGSGRKMAIVYPTPTFVLHHPALVFATGSERQVAAQKWLEFLRSEEMQTLALELGFRPVHPGVSTRGHDTDKNRFLRLRHYGVQPQPNLKELPPPSGRAIQELITLWGDATGRY